MRYLSTLTSILDGATLTATNTIASQAWEQISRTAQGGGTVELTGSFTGADDSTFDIEVLSNTINVAPQISQEQFSGVGNGRISNITADSGIAAQEFTVTVLSLGTPTRQAYAPFQGVVLRAINSGSAGNAFSLRISQAGLTNTDTQYAVTQEIGAGESEFEGEAFNFGAANIEPEGTVPANAPRLRFGDDVVVYRHWRRYSNGRYRYYLSPEPARTIPVGTRVYAVTGTREATLYDGSTLIETYASITTLYSLLAAIDATSVRIEVDGVIADDRRPGGMGSDELNVFTASYAAGSERDGTRFVREADIGLTVSSTAPTETLTIECVAAPIPGAEIWRVVGDVSGALDNAVTGVAYADGPYSFTIPVRLQPGAIPPGDKAATLETLDRQTTEKTPVLCVSNFLLGAEASTRTFEFVWSPRPAEDCNCNGAVVRGGPDDDLLGIDPPEGEPVSGIPAPLQSRFTAIADWSLAGHVSNISFSAVSAGLLQNVGFIAGESEPAGAGNLWELANGFLRGVSARLQADVLDMRAYRLVSTMLRAALNDIYAQSGNTLPTAAGTEFDTQFAALQDLLDPLSGIVNGDGWNSSVFGLFAETVRGTAGVDFEIADGRNNLIAQQASESLNWTQDTTAVRLRVEESINKIYDSAGLYPPFDVATRKGNDVWQDHGGPAWFASRDGLLPIQPGYYYHSCRLERDEETGEDVAVSTRQFGIGVAIGCPESLKFGDRIIIKIGPYANARATYDTADRITVEVIRADPVQLGGGQTGDDTITFSVRGTDAGALANYALDTTAPAPYSDSGLGFLITPGAIDFAPGDRWTFSAEGGTFRWRRDGGSWTTTDITATVSLAAGVSARFVAGPTPSWRPGDTYALRALASNGIGRARTPSDEAFAWTSSTQIDITPTGGAVDSVLIGDHTIPDTATITLRASDDNWSTVAFEQVLAWRSRNIAAIFAARTHAKWRLIINTAGSIRWLYLGEAAQLTVTGSPTVIEHGNVRRTYTLANGRRSRGVGIVADHTDVSGDSLDELMLTLERALSDDEGRMAVISPEAEPSLVTIADDALDVSEVYGHQPASNLRRHRVTLQLQAA